MKLQKVKIAKFKIQEDKKDPITSGCFDFVGINLVPSLPLCPSANSADQRTAAATA